MPAPHGIPDDELATFQREAEEEERGPEATAATNWLDLIAGGTNEIVRRARIMRDKVQKLEGERDLLKNGRREWRKLFWDLLEELTDTHNKAVAAKQPLPFPEEVVARLPIWNLLGMRYNDYQYDNNTGEEDADEHKKE